MFDHPTINSFTGNNFFLSNFFVSRMSVLFDKVFIEVPTVEHAYQAYKTLDEVERIKILSAPGPGAAKRLGKQVTIRSDWDLIKVPVMLNLLRIKFTNPTLKQWLLDTKDATLIEGNWGGDKVWGVCNGEGRNMLGTLLMNIREEIRNEDQRSIMA